MAKEPLETIVTRIDERTEYMKAKLDDHCKWKEKASVELGVLKEAKLPNRVSKLEMWAKYRDGALALLLLLVGAGRVIDFVELLSHK